MLILANALFFGWSQGWLDGVAGARAGGDREPERLALQVRPEAIRVLGAQAAAALAASAAASALAASAALLPASAASASVVARAAPVASAVSSAAPASAAGSAAVATLACLEAGPFGAAELGAAEAALEAALPAGRWVDVKTVRGGAWIIYMGRYANSEAQAKKEEELNRIKVSFEPVTEPPNLAPGLALGRFEARPAADAALAQFARRGIRTARVVELTPPVVSHLLRVDRADARLVDTLKGLAGPALGRGFSACRGARPAPR